MTPQHNCPRCDRPVTWYPQPNGMRYWGCDYCSGLTHEQWLAEGERAAERLKATIRKAVEAA